VIKRVKKFWDALGMEQAHMCCWGKRNVSVALKEQVALRGRIKDTTGPPHMEHR